MSISLCFKACWNLMSAASLVCCKHVIYLVDARNYDGRFLCYYVAAEY